MRKQQESLSKEAYWIIEPRQSKLGFVLVYGMGMVTALGASALALHGSSQAELVFAGLLALLAMMLLAVGRIIGLAKGGVAHDPERGNLCWFGCGTRDMYQVPVSEIAGISVERRMEYWGGGVDPTLVSSILVVQRNGLRVLLLQLPSLQDAEDRAAMIREATGLARVSGAGATTGAETGTTAPSETDEPVPVSFAGFSSWAGLKQVKTVSGQTALELSRGFKWGLAWPIMLMGLFSLVSGILLLWDVGATGVLGFLFGPVFGALGIILLLIIVFRVFGRETLQLGNGKVVQWFSLAGLKWGRREISWGQADSLPRLLTRGVHGFQLEIQSETSTLVVGAGSSSAGPLPPAALGEVGLWLMGQKS